MCVGSMPKDHVRSLAGEIDGDPVLDRLHHQNICYLKPAHFARMAQTLVRDASNNLPSQICTADTEDPILSCLEGIDQSAQQNAPSRADRNVDLVREVVALTHERCSDTALTMSELTQRLFTSKTVLSVAIRQSTGLSPLS